MDETRSPRKSKSGERLRRIHSLKLRCGVDPNECEGLVICLPLPGAGAILMIESGLPVGSRIALIGPAARKRSHAALVLFDDFFNRFPTAVCGLSSTCRHISDCDYWASKESTDCIGDAPEQIVLLRLFFELWVVIPRLVAALIAVILPTRFSFVTRMSRRLLASGRRLAVPSTGRCAPGAPANGCSGFGTVISSGAVSTVGPNLSHHDRKPKRKANGCYAR